MTPERVPAAVEVAVQLPASSWCFVTMSVRCTKVQLAAAALAEFEAVRTFVRACFGSRSHFI